MTFMWAISSKVDTAAHITRRWKLLRCAIFHNHCKIIVGFGEKFDFAIESSTNLNVNLRLEQTTIYVNRELAQWYKAYFDEIHAFNRDFDNWEPWEDGK